MIDRDEEAVRRVSTDASTFGEKPNWHRVFHLMLHEVRQARREGFEEGKGLDGLAALYRLLETYRRVGHREGALEMQERAAMLFENDRGDGDGLTWPEWEIRQKISALPPEGPEREPASIITTEGMKEIRRRMSDREVKT